MLKFLLLFYSIFYLTATTNAQNNFNPIPKDFNRLVGSWQGSLTYLDYSSGKPYTMAAVIEIKKVIKTNQFVFSNIYPNELSANSIDTIVISTDGKYIDKETVKSRRKLANGDIEIITEESGKDGNDNKPAIFRHTYSFGTTTYSNKKDVQFIGNTKWINRHIYSYSKKPIR